MRVWDRTLLVFRENATGEAYLGELRGVGQLWNKTFEHIP